MDTLLSVLAAKRTDSDTVKTTAPRIAALEARVRALHPYDLPEFVVIPIVQGSAGYLAWLTESTK